MPLVDGISFAARASIATAARSARANPLKHELGDVMIVGAVEGLEVQRQPAVHCERLKPFPHQLGVEGANLVAHECHIEHQERAPRNVDRHPRERLVHGHVHIGVAGDAFHVAERLLDRLPERDTDVLGGMVVVDVQVALGLDGEIDAGMARQKLEHVVEKADAGRDRASPAAVDVDHDLDIGFLGGAIDRPFAHALSRVEPRAL